MSTYWQEIAKAESVIAAAETGTYDAALGITPELRSALDRAKAGEQLTDADLVTLSTHRQEQVISDAHAAGLFDNLTHQEN